jgi:glycosyltransferase involved in cell wall biosynthesis
VVQAARLSAEENRPAACTTGRKARRNFKPTSKPRPRRTLVMMVRNEERNLPNCLRSAAALFDRVLVIDTGSTDRTRDLAREFGAEVYDFPWCDSFAAARNEGLRHCVGDWVVWLDVDDRLDPDQQQRLRELRGSLRDDDPDGYVLPCRCENPPGHPDTVVQHVRLFRNRLGLLELEPRHAEARRNLAVLLRRRDA